MQKIDKLILCDFKFFHGSVELQFERKNILLYGENGSGKSSIYWALYTFLQSVFKNDDEEIKKYFNPSSEQNLINRFSATSTTSSIKVEFLESDGTVTGKEISYSIINTKSGNMVLETARTSDFINYRLLLSFYNFSHRDSIDLFPLFEHDILMFITFPGNKNANDQWQSLASGMQPRPRMSDPLYIEFQQHISEFNRDFNDYLERIIESANEYLQQEFKEKLKIKLTYSPCSYDDFLPGSTTKRNHETIPPKISLTVDYTHDLLLGGNEPINRPHSFLNEARLTSIALSIRFAILDEKYIDAAPKILVLDDLLISLDMSNRDAVLEVILKKFSDYQIFILTHDRLFFELAKHKINKHAKEDWKYIEMFEQTISNIPQPFITTSETYLEKAKKYFVKKEYEAAGNFLRKEAESFCKDFLPRKRQITPDSTFYDLNGLVIQCVNMAIVNGLDPVSFEELDNHRKFVLNPVSHDSYDVPKYNSEIQNCINTLDKLRAIRFETVLKNGDEIEFTLSTPTGDTYRFEIVIHDDIRLIKEPSHASILSKGLVNYIVYKNGTSTPAGLQHGIESIKSMYDHNYNHSDKSKSADFWDEVIFTSTGQKLNTIRTF